MDLKQLSYFVKIVEEGSISGAAKKPKEKVLLLLLVL